MAATVLLVGAGLVGSKALLPASAQTDPTADPLPIHYIIQIQNPESGERIVMYASDMFMDFPADGTFEYTRWRTKDGALEYKAKISLRRISELPIPHDPGDGEGNR